MVAAAAISLQPRIGYDLILARSTPPPSIGEASFMRGHFHHRTNCSSTGHKEGLRRLLAPGGSHDEAFRASLSLEAQGQTSIPSRKHSAAPGARPRRPARGLWRLEFARGQNDGNRARRETVCAAGSRRSRAGGRAPTSTRSPGASRANSFAAGAVAVILAASKLQPPKPSCRATRSSAWCSGMFSARDRSLALRFK